MQRIERHKKRKDSKMIAQFPDLANVGARSEEFRQWLANRPEKTILIVTHREFMRRFTNQGVMWLFTECGVMERRLSSSSGHVDVVPWGSGQWVPDQWYILF